MIRDVRSVNTPSGPRSSRPSDSTWAINRSDVASSINGFTTVSISLSVVVMGDVLSWLSGHLTQRTQHPPLAGT